MAVVVVAPRRVRMRKIPGVSLGVPHLNNREMTVQKVSAFLSLSLSESSSSGSSGSSSSESSDEEDSRSESGSATSKQQGNHSAEGK